MNDSLARELIDVLQECASALQDIASAQRVIERHLAEIRFNISDLGMRDDLTKFEVQEKRWHDERNQIAKDQEDEGL
jgi:hypothetical protein